MNIKYNEIDFVYFDEQKNDLKEIDDDIQQNLSMSSKN